MVKHVEGYMSDDGVFFYELIDASKHEAEMALRVGCSEHTPPINADRFIHVLEALADQCGKYLDAYQKINQIAAHTFESDRNTRDDGRGSEDINALEQFEVSGYEPVPDVGDSPSGEAVPGTKSKHGARMRRDNA